MSNDFASLLSNFASATGGSATESFKVEAPATSNKKNKKNKSLKELTANLWQRSQLRQSVKSLQSTAPSPAASTNKDATTSTETDEKVMKPIHLAICLCVVDRVTHERVWEEWIRNNSSTHISAELHVHAKSPERITNPWTKSKLISVSHRPNWNDVRIVKAMLSLMEEALKKDDKTTHIVFGTESCLPICPLSQVTVEHDKSYVQYYGKNQATRFDERDVWDVLLQHMPLDSIHKALPGWCTLASDHAREILQLPTKHLEGQDLWKAFDECWAPEEAFFPTALALLGLLVPEKTECKSLTYAEWTNERTKRPEDKAHPKQWDREFDARLISSLRRDHESIILRKIKYPVPVSRWREVMFSAAGDSATTNNKRSPHEMESNHGGPNKKSRDDVDYNNSQAW